MIEEFIGAPLSKKIFILHFYDIPKSYVYDFLEDVCKRKDYLYAIAILTNGRSAHHFENIVDVEFFKSLKNYVNDHDLLCRMIDDIISNHQKNQI